MNDFCAESQEIVTRCRKKLDALANKLDVQRATLRNLRRMAKDLAPLMEGVEKAENLPEQYQRQLSETLHEIDSITESMRPKKVQKPSRRHNLV